MKAESMKVAVVVVVVVPAEIVEELLRRKAILERSARGPVEAGHGEVSEISPARNLKT